MPRLLNVKRKGPRDLDLLKRQAIALSSYNGHAPAHVRSQFGSSRHFATQDRRHAGRDGVDVGGAGAGSTGRTGAAVTLERAGQFIRHTRSPLQLQSPFAFGTAAEVLCGEGRAERAGGLATRTDGADAGAAADAGMGG
jgi:hypothetical protein